jgi:uncharacterized membrane protein YfcA
MARPLLILAVAFVATLLGSISGGSSSLLMTPSWLALGFPLPTAVAADKIAGTFWTGVGARNYLRGRAVDWRLVAMMGVLGAGAAVAGAAVTVAVDPVLLERVVGVLLLIAIGGVARRPRLAASDGAPRWGRGVVGGAAIPLGFYEGLLGSGNSIAATVLLCYGRGLELLSALGHYYLVAAAWCGVAAATYLAQGSVDLTLTIPATLGAIAGGYLGSRLGARFGGVIVRRLFLLAGVVLASKLLLGW